MVYLDPQQPRPRQVEMHLLQFVEITMAFQIDGATIVLQLDNLISHHPGNFIFSTVKNFIEH